MKEDRHQKKFHKRRMPNPSEIRMTPRVVESRKLDEEVDIPDVIKCIMCNKYREEEDFSDPASEDPICIDCD